MGTQGEREGEICAAARRAARARARWEQRRAGRATERRQGRDACGGTQGRREGKMGATARRAGDRAQTRARWQRLARRAGSRAARTMDGGFEQFRDSLVPARVIGCHRCQDAKMFHDQPSPVHSTGVRLPAPCSPSLPSRPCLPAPCSPALPSRQDVTIWTYRRHLKFFGRASQVARRLMGSDHSK